MLFSRSTVSALAVAGFGAVLLAGCAPASEAESSPTASTSPAAEQSVNVGDVVADVKTLTGCETFGGTWAGGKVAGEDVVAAWEYTCDVDGDGTVETTLAIYDTAEDQEADLAVREADSADTALLEADGYTITTTDSSHFQTFEGDGLTVARELPAA
ncbi:hypothetical protein [Demequina sp. NBRC 110051]|uniref:hypothetical protein n=1 Tax=Demequina sp. NBRC 110051 TaxID=1570340 RepID=UPI000A0380F3|nr:hypothetical protein [Demequina sp. NBRC 110051]